MWLGGGLVLCSSASGQSILFDFDNAPLHSPLPIDLTVGGITAHFSGNPSYYNYSVQRADALGFTPVGFYGYCIYPSTIYPCDLLVSFSSTVTATSILYAPEEYATDSSCRMRITAYRGTTFVGTNTHIIPEPGTWPTGTLSFSSTQPFDNIVVHYDAPPVTGGDYGPIFMADNLMITTAPTPSPTPSPTPTATATPPAPVCFVSEGFDDIATLPPGGWVMQNNSQPLGSAGWLQGLSGTFVSQSGSPDSYVAANFSSGNDISTLSNWLLTPPLILQNGGQLTFWTRTVDFPAYPDRMQVRMSSNGASANVGSAATDVGDFTALLLDINPFYSVVDYPNVWTRISMTISGLGGPVNGRLAFRYFVEGGGPAGVNSDYIGIDTVDYACTGVPTPTPALVTISGVISYCPSPTSGAVPNVTITVTGTSGGSTVSDSLGNYQTISLPSSGSYVVTPTKSVVTPGTSAINTVDVIAIQRHFLNVGPTLTGCRQSAADVNGDSAINTIDVVAVQRFFLGLSTGIANTGKYQFAPTSRSYVGLISDQAGQNYDALVLGDVATSFVHRSPGDSSRPNLRVDPTSGL